MVCPLSLTDSHPSVAKLFSEAPLQGGLTSDVSLISDDTSSLSLLPEELVSDEALILGDTDSSGATLVVLPEAGEISYCIPRSRRQPPTTRTIPTPLFVDATACGATPSRQRPRLSIPRLRRPLLLLPPSDSEISWRFLCFQPAPSLFQSFYCTIESRSVNFLRAVQASPSPFTFVQEVLQPLLLPPMPDPAFHCQNKSSATATGDSSAVMQLKSNPALDLIGSHSSYSSHRREFAPEHTKPTQPDFKHKDGEALWLNSAPAWVIPKLPPQDAVSK
ncbi:hypothetical protein KSP39_PZI001639 [Platanthera zijinensis]|uniref:Uncharacterized protein n=1 Tax=Platanthera zijinensis TaxID=2320716 RepID=A0AAP0BZ68_9ASPA